MNGWLVWGHRESNSSQKEDITRACGVRWVRVITGPQREKKASGAKEFVPNENFLAKGDSFTSVTLLKVFLDIRRVRAAFLFPLGITINPVTHTNRANPKPAVPRQVMPILFLHWKKSGHLWFCFGWLDLFSMAFFLSFLGRPVWKKFFCLLYLRNSVYGFGQATLFFLPDVVFSWSFCSSPEHHIFFVYAKKNIFYDTLCLPFYFFVFQNIKPTCIKYRKTGNRILKKALLQLNKEQDWTKNKEPRSVQKKWVLDKGFNFRIGKKPICLGGWE